MASRSLRCRRTRAELVVQLGGHVVERLGQGADLQRIGHRQTVGEVSAGEAFGPLLELLERPGDAAGMPEAHCRQQPRHQQAPGGDVQLDGGKGRGGGRQGDRRPHHPQLAAVGHPALAREHRPIEHVLLQRNTEPGRRGAAAVQHGGHELGTVGVIFHLPRQIPAIAPDGPVGQNDGQPRIGLLAEFLAQGLDGGHVWLVGRQQGTKLGLDQRRPAQSGPRPSAGGRIATARARRTAPRPPAKPA